MTAPSCPISTSQQKISTSQRQRTGADVNNIPPAHDLRSVITAINRMSHVVQNITRGTPQVNNVYPQGAAGVPDPAPPEPFPGYDDMSWRETDRNYAKETIKAPDPSQEGQYIDIQVITYVRWREENSGHQLEYVGRGV